MIPEEIKKEVDMLSERREADLNRIYELQSICKHELTFEGTYMWHPGSFNPATFCSLCGKMLKDHFDINNFEIRKNEF